MAKYFNFKEKNNYFFQFKTYLAHKDENVSEYLEEHLYFSYYVARLILKKINLKNFLKDNNNDNEIKIKKFILSLSLFHDLGKVNLKFQEKLKNTININEFNIDFKDSEHSKYFYIFKDKIRDENFVLLEDLIKQHHTNFDNDFTNIDVSGLIPLRTIKNKYKKSFYHLQQIIKQDSFLFFLHLSYSIMIVSDIISTKFIFNSEFKYRPFNNKYFLKENIFNLRKYFYKNYSNNFFLSDEKREHFENFKYNKLIYNDNKKLQKNNINFFKNMIAKDMRENIKVNIENIYNNINFLEINTGLGKTNLSFLFLNEITKYKNFNKVFFIIPQNNILYQTLNDFKEKFNISNDDEYSIFNSIENSEEKSKEEKSNYKEENNLYNKNIVFTTHVNFFDRYLSILKSSKLSLCQLFNSLIIIDEIQLYNLQLLGITYDYLGKLKEFLNCTILILSATIPKNSKFTKDFVDRNMIIKKEILQVSNKFASKRVNINLDYYLNFVDKNYKTILDKNKKENFIKFILELLKNNNKILITTNSIKDSHKVYEIIKDLEIEILFYNNTILPFYQDFVLNKVKKDEKLIMIATKKIEAGIDISFDCGVKFLNHPYEIYQNSGRINRYFENKVSNLYLLYAPIYFTNENCFYDYLNKNCSKDSIVKFLQNPENFYIEVFKILEKDKESKFNKYINILNNLNFSEFKNNSFVQIDNNIYKNIWVNISKETYDKYKNLINIDYDNINIKAHKKDFYFQAYLSKDIKLNSIFFENNKFYIIDENDDEFYSIKKGLNINYGNEIDDI